MALKGRKFKGKPPPFKGSERPGGIVRKMCEKQATRD
jgi:hypothetical protein